MRNLDSRVRELEQRTRGIPSRFAGGGAPTPVTPAPEVWVKVVGGNTLTGGVTNGIKRIATQLASQTVWRDPYGTGTFPDGLGRVQIWRNGEQGFVRDADAWKVGTAYGIGDKVRGTTQTQAFVCTVAGTSAAAGPGPTGTGTGIVDNDVTWDYDATVGWKAEQALALLDTRAQWAWAVGETEWSRVWSAVVVGNAVDPATGLAADFSAYPLAYL